MTNGIAASLVLHAIIFTVIIFGLPSFSGKKNITQEQVVTVEILPVSEITNVKPKRSKPQAKPTKKPKAKQKKEDIKPIEQPKKFLPDPAKKPNLVKETNLEPLPTPKEKNKKENKIKAPQEKPKKKPENKKKSAKNITMPREKHENEAPKDSFASVLKTIEEIEHSNEEENKEKNNEVNFDEIEDFLSNIKDNNQYKEGLPLSLSEKDYIRQQIIKNWTILAGAKNIQDMVVTLNISLSPDGTVNDIEIEDQSRYSSDTLFRAVVDSAIRAVRKSSPISGLPQDKYDTKGGWREIQFNFDTSEMIY